MGKMLPWGHKQLHIEAEKKTATHHRGFNKNRKKGKKARVDELLAGKKVMARYAEWIVDERQRRIDHPEWYKPLPKNSRMVLYNPRYEYWFDGARAKQHVLITAALRDGVIGLDQVKDFLVEKP